MGLSNQQMARLGELLDESLTITPEQRRVWLETLPRKDKPLVRGLREACWRMTRPASQRTAGSNAAHRGTGAPKADDRPPRGERLGAYELLRPLGAGGMAEVWLASRADGAFERQVALKIPHLRDMPAEMVERFARECRILATLESPNIARLYDAGVDSHGRALHRDGVRPGRATDDLVRCPWTANRQRVSMSSLQVLDAVATRTTPDPPSRPEAVEHPRHGTGRSAPAGFRRGATAAGGGRVLPHDA